MDLQHIQVERWRVAEISLESTRPYPHPFTDVEVLALFTGPEGQIIRRPAFWDGERTWRIRFAPTACGDWRMETTCSDPADDGLHGMTATIHARDYSGDLPVYRHGFVKAERDTRYLTYDDSTPFLWLSDEHACMDGEKWDESNKPGTISQFQAIADLRKSQQFTVYQSVIWTAGHWTEPGVEPQLSYYQELDLKFEYLANLGFVHSTALGYHTDLGNAQGDPLKITAMRRAARYVEARYGAYPMVYYTCGEFNIPCDSAMEGFDPALQQEGDSYARMWWGEVAQAIEEHNAYHHPLSINYWQPQGNWFAAEPFHHFWALQAYILRDQRYYHYFHDYQPAKPIIDAWSGMDHNDATSQDAQRAIAYVIMQSGGAGWGHLTEGIWNNCYTKDSGICVDSWGGTPWFLSVDWQGARYMTLAHEFYSSLEWWKLQPRVGNSAWGTFADPDHSPLSNDGNSTYVVYFFGLGTGVLANMDDSQAYSGQWYNPRDGSYTPLGTIRSSNGAWQISPRPDDVDWVLLVRRLSIADKGSS